MRKTFFLAACFPFGLAAILFFYPLISRPYAVLKAREGAGLFSMMSDVIALLNAYEKGKVSGFEIDFGAEGVYYEPGEGPNWWLYFCEPLQEGSPGIVVKGPYGKIPGAPPYEFFTSRDEVHDLIDKYIRFKPFIVSSVDQFFDAHFAGFSVIGIHYRGTDWSWGNNFPKIPYALFGEKAQALIQENPTYKIFVATDEQPFLDYMLAMFGDRVCFQKGIYRSEGVIPLHTDASFNRRKQAEEAVIDCLLLSKTDILIGTRSNLSRWASFFNPKILYIDLSHSP